MSPSWFVVTLILCFCVLAVLTDKRGEPCTENGVIRFESIMRNDTCGTVEGRVQICEDLVWKKLCDSAWTLQDARVACKSLGFTDLGASNFQMEQSFAGSSHHGVNCTGSEQSITECTKNMEAADGSCFFSSFVRCHNASSCLDTEEESTTTTQPTPSDGTNVEKTITNNSSVVTSSSDSSESSTTTLADTEPTSHTAEQSSASSTAENSSFFEPPTLYYFVIGVSAIALAAILIAAFLFLYCCCYKSRKGVSPTDAAQREKGGGPQQQLRVNYTADAQKVKEHVPAHHQIQQSQQPIYEAIASNENSSTHSQDSPSAKPLLPAIPITPLPLPMDSNQVYSSLQMDQHSTYAQIEPHISSPVSAGISNQPDPESYYQQLNHQTGSLKRQLPKKPVQALNPTALAVVRGEVDESELAAQAEMVGGGRGGGASSSMSLPTNTGRSQQVGTMDVASTLPQHPARVRKEADFEQHCGNIYNILEDTPPTEEDSPPDYNTLEQIEECSQVSTTAVCNNVVSQENNNINRHAAQHHHHHQQDLPSLPQVGHVFHEGSNKSATLPHGSHHSSPRTSRTSSLSSQSNHSPLVGRAGSSSSNSNSSSSSTAPGGRVSNKYTDPPTRANGGGGILQNSSPRPVRLNRLSGHSDASDTRDTLV